MTVVKVRSQIEAVLELPKGIISLLIKQYKQGKIPEYIQKHHTARIQDVATKSLEELQQADAEVWQAWRAFFKSITLANTWSVVNTAPFGANTTTVAFGANYNASAPPLLMLTVGNQQPSWLVNTVPPNSGLTNDGNGSV